MQILYKQGKFQQGFSLHPLGLFYEASAKLNIFTQQISIGGKPNETTHSFNYLVNTITRIEGILASFLTYKNNHV